LYEDSKKEPKLKVEYKPYTERVMEGCTFKPKIAESSKEFAENIKPIKGYDQAIQRFRTAAEDKRKLQDKIDRTARGAGYDEARKKKAKAFNLKTNEAKTKKLPEIIVEVTIMPGKSTKIPLYPTDSPERIADNLAKIYHLSKTSQENLVNALREQIRIITAK